MNGTEGERTSGDEVSSTSKTRVDSRMSDEREDTEMEMR